MKKAVWILAIIALAVTAVAIPFLPESVPVHFNGSWQPDRWGSPYEMLLLPVLLLVLAVVWTAVLNRFEKEAAEAEDEKTRASALANQKTTGIAGISLTAMLTLLQAWLLFIVYRASDPGGEVAGAGMERLPFILVGLIFVVVGNIMPKTRRNGFVGFRFSWSMYNDDTWRRVHRFGGYAMVLTGILVMIASGAIPSALTAVVVLMALLAAALIVTLVYAKRVYREEKERSEKGEN